jgi:VanZ family protein
MILRFLLFPAVWTIIIGLFTIMPGGNMPDTNYFFSFDKIAHAFVFGLQVFLLTVALAKQYSYPYLKQKHVLLGLVLPLLYGIVIEFAQAQIPGRGFAVNDMAADAAGCFAGFLIFYLVYKL